MKKDFKEIALQLGIAIPVCLLSIEANAEERLVINKGIEPINLEQNEVMQMLAVNNNAIISNEMPLMQHGDRHTNTGGDHSNTHTNVNHSDYHNNVDAYTRGTQCMPHANRHTNTAPHTNSHANSGPHGHADYHTNVTPRTGC